MLVVCEPERSTYGPDPAVLKIESSAKVLPRAFHVEANELYLFFMAFFVVALLFTFFFFVTLFFMMAVGAGRQTVVVVQFTD